MKIKSTIITPMPRPMPLGMFDPMPEVIATFEGGTTKRLFSFYPDEDSFRESEFIGLTEEEAHSLYHDRKPGLIAWLRNIGKDQATVRLDWQKRGHLTLSHRDAEGRSDILHVPVEIHGSPPVIAFNARYLADALEIGSTLHLSDELSPGICRHPTGRFCVIMPMRVTIPASVTREVEAAPTPKAQAA